jgi:hypothetical protein
VSVVSVYGNSGSLDWAQERDRRQRTPRPAECGGPGCAGPGYRAPRRPKRGCPGSSGRRPGPVGVQAPSTWRRSRPGGSCLTRAMSWLRWRSVSRGLRPAPGRSPSPSRPSALNRLMRSRTVWGWQWSSAGDLAGVRSVPAAGDHPDAGNQVARGVAAGRQLAGRAFLSRILGWSGR